MIGSRNRLTRTGLVVALIGLGLILLGFVLVVAAFVMMGFGADAAGGTAGMTGFGIVAYGMIPAAIGASLIVLGMTFEWAADRRRRCLAPAQF